MTTEEIQQRAAAATAQIKRLSRWGVAPDWEAARIIVADAIRMAVEGELAELERAMEAQQIEEDHPRGRYL